MWRIPWEDATWGLVSSVRVLCGRWHLGFRGRSWRRDVHHCTVLANGRTCGRIIAVYSSRGDWQMDTRSIVCWMLSLHCVLLQEITEGQTCIILDNESNFQLGLYFKLWTETFPHRTYIAIKYRWQVMYTLCSMYCTQKSWLSVCVFLVVLNWEVWSSQ